MNGFLPLIEALLAFAITMLALATAVSAAVGAVLRANRMRARYLRDSLIYLYRNEVVPWMEAAAAAVPRDDALRRNFLAEMTMLPREFSAAPSGDEATAREAVVGASSASSYKDCLDNLSTEDFLTRFQRTKAAIELSKTMAAAEFEARCKALGQAFETEGSAASERFARMSRSLTVAFGFGFVFLVNVDSLNLLATYMTNPEAREAVTSRMAEILDEADQPDGVLQEFKQAANGVETALGKASEQAGEIIEALKKAQAETPTEKLEDLSKSLEQAARGLKAASGASEQMAASIGAVRAAQASIVERFPVGWALYPNCGRSTPDVRCDSVRASSPTVPAGESFAHIRQYLLRLFHTLSEDTGGFVKWLAGVILTGFMVGLGAPFWVQVVNGFLRARGLISGGNKTADRRTATA